MEEQKLQSDHNIKRRPEKNLHNFYTVLLETGLLLALGILIILFRIDFKTKEYEVVQFAEQEAVEMEEIVQTQQQERVPPPPRPPVPVAVPNSEIIEDVDINIDAELDFNMVLDLPPPPPQAVQKEADTVEEDNFFVIVEQMPELIGGLEALQREVKYPDKALRANIQGRVYLQFIVNEKGEVENPEVVRGIGGGCDEEALRVVRMAKFKPGLQRGRPVRVLYNLPVIFIIRS